MLNNKNVSITVSGLSPYSQYSYEFNSIDANWPTVVTPSSGVFFTNNLSFKTIKTRVHFCENTGLCPSGAQNVFDYSITECLSNPINLYSNMSLSLKEYGTNNILINDTVEVLCEDCLPKIAISIPTAVSLSSSNSQNISVSISGLVPKQLYNYRFIGLDANWPVLLSKPSGQFLTKDSTETVVTNITFCPTSGICQDAQKTPLVYNLDNSCIAGTTSQYATIQFELTPVSCNTERRFTDPLTVTCLNCLPQLSITSPSNIVLGTTNKNIYSLQNNVSGLRPNEIYSYEYLTNSSNWPTVIIPSTGSFVATERSQTISSRIMFCSPQSLCPTGTNGLVPYHLDDYASQKLKENVLSTTIQLKVTPETCDIPAKIGKPFTLSCSGCLPSFSYASINFADTPELLLPSGCCSGVRAITVDVSGAVPGDKYSYLFDSVSDNVSFSPSTGTVYFGSNGVGAMNSILTSTLLESQQVVINCTLQHSDTNIGTIDFLTVKCDGSCVH
jgi:hypothetical protein